MLRFVNLGFAGLFLVGTSISLLFMPDALARYAQEPEDALLIGGWAGIFGMLAALCVANAALWRSRLIVGLNLAVTAVLMILLIALVVLDGTDWLGAAFLVACAVPAATTAASQLWPRRSSD